MATNDGRVVRCENHVRHFKDGITAGKFPIFRWRTFFKTVITCPRAVTIDNKDMMWRHSCRVLRESSRILIMCWRAAARERNRWRATAYYTIILLIKILISVKFTATVKLPPSLHLCVCRSIIVVDRCETIIVHQLDGLSPFTHLGTKIFFACCNGPYAMFDRIGRLCQYIDMRSPAADQGTIVVHVERN